MITGSNVYNKKAGVLEVPGFVGPQIVDNHAAFEVPVEPVGGYDTHISHKTFEYNVSFNAYDASLCASICKNGTKNNSKIPSPDDSPFVDGAYAVCSMFVAYELRKTGKPVAMACDIFSSVWSGHYQSLRMIHTMEISKVSVYRRDDYQYPAICAIKEHCRGDEWYEGGDCSGWGPKKCRELPHKDEPWDDPERDYSDEGGSHDQHQDQKERP